MTDLISIIIPVYNTEKYLVKCLDSVIKQTYKNLEIILVDDGSTDRSPEICEEYGKLDGRIKVLHQKNSGQSVARNNAIEISTGTYLGFVDSDDYIDKDMFEKLYHACIRNNSDIAVCGYYRVNEEGKVDKIFLPSIKDEVITQKEAVYEILKDTRVFSFLWDKLFKKELFDHIRFPEGKIFEDVASVFQIVNNAKTITLCPFSKYYYAIRTSSTITLKNNQKFDNQLEAYNNQMEYARQFCKEGMIWIDYHMAEVKRRILDWKAMNHTRDIDACSQELMHHYRRLLQFILKSSHISFGKKMSALLMCISPSAYILIRHKK